VSRPIKDFTGMKFGYLDVIRFDGVRGRNAYWLCRCKCGVEKAIIGQSLRKGQGSCGCNTGKRISESKIEHGKSKTSEFAIWVSMIQRCTNKNAASYPYYGGRGISVCDSWLNSFEAFLGDMGIRPSSSHSIERIENDGNYEPANCRWANDFEQACNRRNNVRLTVNGVTLIVAEWARKIGVIPSVIHNRIRRGWSAEQAITPVRSKACRA